LTAGWTLVSNPVVVLATMAVAAAGLWGLSRSDMPERLWLMGCLSVGVFAIAAGYHGPLGSIVAGPVRTLLNGGLSPLRNIDKFEPLVRLPLAVGFGYAVTVLAARASALTRWQPGLAGWRPIELGMTLLVVGAAFPLISGQLAQPGAFAGIPQYWKDAAAWLNGHATDTRALIAPAAPFGEYTWGRPLDEALQSLTHTPLAVRNLIPLGSVGATRLLDQITQAVDGGRADPNLAPSLARAGVGFVVVRNDLDPFRSGAPPPVYVQRALAFSAGLNLAASFGPVVSGGMLLDRVVPGAGPHSVPPIHAVDIYSVAGAAGQALAYPLAGTVVATGGPESVGPVLGTGIASDRAIVLAGDTRPLAGVATTPVITDGLQRRDIDPGLVRGDQSYVLTANEPSPYTGKTPLQRVDPGGGQHQTVAVVAGASAIKASSVASFDERLPGAQPYSAFDGDPSTAWVPDPARNAVGQWIEIDLNRSIDPTAISVRRFADHPWRPQITELKVVTDTGTMEDRLNLFEATQAIGLPPGPTPRIRLVIAAVSSTGAGTNGAGLAEVDIPGVHVTRSLASPADQPANAHPAAVVLNRALAPAFDSHQTDEESRLSRIVTLGAGGSFALSGTAVTRPGFALTAMLNINDTPSILAIGSSTWGDQPAFAGQQAVDGDATTQWLADPADPNPTLSLLWTEPRTIDSIRLVPGTAPSLIPVHVRLTSAAGTRDVEVLNDRPVTFAPLKTQGVNVVVVDSVPNAALAHTAAIITPPAVGIGEVDLGGIGDLVPHPSPADEVVIPCGYAPQVTIDGHPVLTQAIGSRQDFLDSNPVAIVPCDFKPLSLSAGRHNVQTDAAGPVGIAGLTLLPVGNGPSAGTPSARAPSVRILTWGPTSRSVEVGPGAGILATTENFNAGWTAMLNGVRLKALRVDGWRQAWILPGRGGQIALRYTPDSAYRKALGVGALLLVGLALAALIPGRRRVNGLANGSMGGRGWVALATLMLLVLGGAAVVAVPALLALPHRTRVLPGLAAGLPAAAGLVIAFSGTALPGSGAGAFGWQAQLLVLVGIAAALLASVPKRRRTAP
jgi:arabinofuranan 3-O-arabinosyltransferase